MKLIIFDFEVFKYDTLLGALIINNEKIDVFQSWDLNEIKEFYYENIDNIWIGHNNERYDNLILQSIIKNQNPYIISKQIIEEDIRHHLKINLNYYDLMNSHPGKLKAIECAVGKNISESKISFDINRSLTFKEKLEIENYNLDDLDQTIDDLYYSKGEFLLRLDIMNEFNLTLDTLHLTEAQIAEKVLHAEKIDNIENWYVKPPIFENLFLENKEIWNFYKNEEFRKKGKLITSLAGLNHNLGSGGIHGAINNYHGDWAYYFDVSGYYNLIMILKNLLPRSIPDEYKKYYEYMYHKQLELKTTNPAKRPAYKKILLAVFGAMMNKYCKFYDPNNGSLVTIIGQLYAADLLEKLNNKALIIQSNTDGIIAKPLEGINEKEIIDIINEWQTRTGFVLKLEKIYNIHQRDVNNYMYEDKKGKIEVRGEYVKYYERWENPLNSDVFNSKEPVIIHYCIVNFFMKNIIPEKTIELYKKNLRMFQYCVKKNSFDWLQYEEYDKNNNLIITKLQDVNRVFALKGDKIGIIYKCKNNGKHDKVANLPDSVFVYNHEILSENTINKLIFNINYDAYIKRAYERILECINHNIIKKVNV